MKQRCLWANNASHLIQTYHDTLWGVPVYDDVTLFKYLVMESAHAGLSWEMIYKREAAYEIAYQGFDPKMVATFDDAMVDAMMQTGIIKHRGKIEASIVQAKVVVAIIAEYTSFANYLWHFVQFEPLVTQRPPQQWHATSPLSDRISRDLQQRGMKYVGSRIIQAYLQAIGIINDHDNDCYLCKQTKHHT